MAKLNHTVTFADGTSYTSKRSKLAAAVVVSTVTEHSKLARIADAARKNAEWQERLKSPLDCWNPTRIAEVTERHAERLATMHALTIGEQEIISWHSRVDLAAKGGIRAAAKWCHDDLSVVELDADGNADLRPAAAEEPAAEEPAAEVVEPDCGSMVTIAIAALDRVDGVATNVDVVALASSMHTTHDQQVREDIAAGLHSTDAVPTDRRDFDDFVAGYLKQAGIERAWAAAQARYSAATERLTAVAEVATEEVERLAAAVERAAPGVGHPLPDSSEAPVDALQWRVEVGGVSVRATIFRGAVLWSDGRRHGAAAFYPTAADRATMPALRAEADYLVRDCVRGHRGERNELSHAYQCGTLVLEPATALLLHPAATEDRPFDALVAEDEPSVLASAVVDLGAYGLTLDDEGRTRSTGADGSVIVERDIAQGDVVVGVLCTKMSPAPHGAMGVDAYAALVHGQPAEGSGWRTVGASAAAGELSRVRVGLLCWVSEVLLERREGVVQEVEVEGEGDAQGAQEVTFGVRSGGVLCSASGLICYLRQIRRGDQVVGALRSYVTEGGPPIVKHYTVTIPALGVDGSARFQAQGTPEGPRGALASAKRWAQGRASRMP